MGLREELKRDWVPTRFVMPANFQITSTTKQLRQIFPPASTPIPPMTNLLKEVEIKLARTRGDLSCLDRRQCMFIPFLLWATPEKWSENEEFVTDFLAWADSNWRAGPSQLWTHYLLNMDPGSLATRRLGTWLLDRQKRLPPPLQAFSEKWDLFRPHHAIVKLASSLLDNANVIAEIESLKIGLEVLLRSALLLSVLESLGQQLANYHQATVITQTIKSLLAPLGDMPTYKMQGPDDLKQGALKSIVEGLVIWTEHQSSLAIDQTLDLLFKLIGDLRLPQYQGRWQPIDKRIRKVVEQWLTRVTIDAFFRFMRELQVNRDDMVQERETFWRGYKKYITQAWLITGRDGEVLATKLLDKSFGKFVPGPNVHRDHLGLMFRLGSYVVLEMNKIGATLFWPAGDQSLPEFSLPEYNRSDFISACPSGPERGNPRFRLIHKPPGGWQRNYKDHIRRITNILPT